MISVQDILMATTNPKIKVEIVVKNSIPSWIINSKNLWKYMICDGVSNVVFNNNDTATIYVSCVYMDRSSIMEKTIKDIQSVCISEFTIKILDHTGIPIISFNSSKALDYIDEYTADKRISSMSFKLVDNKVELSVYLYDRMQL